MHFVWLTQKVNMNTKKIDNNDATSKIVILNN